MVVVCLEVAAAVTKNEHTLTAWRSNVRLQSMQVKLDAEHDEKWFWSLGCEGGVVEVHAWRRLQRHPPPF